MLEFGIEQTNMALFIWLMLRYEYVYCEQVHQNFIAVQTTEFKEVSNISNMLGDTRSCLY